MPRVNILSIIGNLGFGGGENRLLNISRYVNREKFRHTVAVLHDSCGYQQIEQIRAAFVSSGSEVVFLRGPRSKTGIRPRPLKLACTAVTLGLTAERLFHLVRKIKPDLLDAHLDLAMLNSVPVALMTGTPIALTLYHAAPLQPHAFWPSIWRGSVRRAAAIFTDSNPRAQEIATFGKISPNRVHVIPNGVRLGRPSVSKDKLLEAFGINKPLRGGLIIGQVSSIVPFKGHAVLLEAAKIHLQEYPNTIFLCAGYPRDDLDFLRTLEERAKILGLEDRFFIRSYPGDIADVWNVIDIHVHASLFDSLPNAIIEGMSLGKPAVVTAVGGVPEMVEHGITGLVVRPNEAAAIANGIAQLIRDPLYASRLGMNARAKYLKHCTPEKTTVDIERCWAQAAARGAETDAVH